jgi:transposase InsO family protein
MIRNGIDPSPKRSKNLSWAEFIARHKDVMWGCDFFTFEVWQGFQLTTFNVLFFIHLQSRRVVLGGITDNATGTWCEQVAREVAGFHGAVFIPGKRGYLLHDRAKCFTERFAAVFDSVGIEAKKLPPRSPNLNAYAERFVRSIKYECLNYLILIVERSLRRTITQYLEHYRNVA